MSKKQNNNIEVCQWEMKKIEQYIFWETDCDQLWKGFGEISAKKDGFKFCPSCGKQTSVIPF